MKAVLKSISVIVGLPTLVALLYFGFLATDLFVAESRFSVRESSSEAGSSLTSILAAPVISGGNQNSIIVADYIRSHEIVSQLNERLDLAGHYSDKKIDFFARLKSSPTKEELHEYYLRRIELTEDSGGDILVLKTMSPDRHFAKLLADSIIELSEQLVNEMSTRIEEDSLRSARAEVELALQKVKDSNLELSGFRAENTSINPAEETSALLGIVSGMESNLASAKAALAEKRAFMKESSAAVKSLKNKVNALNKQLQLEKSRLVGKDGTGMNQLITEFQPLALNQQLAQQHYTSALTSLELARVEAQRKKLYLITFVKPGLPEQALEPRRIMGVFAVFVYSFLGFGVGALFWSALRDHVGF